MKKHILFFLVLFGFTAFVFTQTTKTEVTKLTLKDCIQKTLTENLDVLVEAITPEISDVSVVEAKEKYWPQFSFNYENWRYNVLSSWAVEGDNYIQKRNTLTLELSQKIFTGGELTFRLSNQVTDTTRSYSIINPFYRGDMWLEFVQPLLKGFGPKAANKDIHKAQNNLDIAVSGLKSNIIQRVNEVEVAYWNLVYAKRKLQVFVNSLQHSENRLEKLKHSLRMGVKSSLDVLQAETEVANRKNSILSANLQVETYENSLKTLMNLPIEDLATAQSIVPLDEPILEKIQISFDEAMKIAMDENPAIIRVNKEIENSKIDVSFSKNQLLPKLDLRASFWFPGQSGNRLIYLNDNPFTGIVVDEIKGNRFDSMTDVFKFKYSNWAIYFTLDIPLQNIFSRANLIKARLEEDKKLLELKREEKAIYQELFAVFKEIENHERQIDLAKEYRVLMEQKLDAEQQKYDLGLATTEWLYQYERDLDQAKSDEIRAIIDYKISVAKLEKTLGINLRSKGIKYKGPRNLN